MSSRPAVNITKSDFVDLTYQTDDGTTLFECSVYLMYFVSSAHTIEEDLKCIYITQRIDKEERGDLFSVIDNTIVPEYFPRSLLYTLWLTANFNCRRRLF